MSNYIFVLTLLVGVFLACGCSDDAQLGSYSSREDHEKASNKEELPESDDSSRGESGDNDDSDDKQEREEEDSEGDGERERPDN